MFKKVDRILVRVANLAAAVRHYEQEMKLSLVRREKRVAIFRLLDSDTELVLHDDPDLPAEAVYFLVDDVRDLYRRRRELKLTFAGPPQQVSRGFRATIKDAYGLVTQIIDRTAGQDDAIEDARPPTGLFPGVAARVSVRRQRLIEIYQAINRTADDLPYTPHFESLYDRYVAELPEPKPDRAEVWRHLLTVRKSGQLPKVGEARSAAPQIEPEQRQLLRDLLGSDTGRRDRLPYTPRFDEIAESFNAALRRPMSPHLIWRLIATLAK